MSTNKKKVLIGIQPSGRLHIGNYLGVIKKGIELQSEYDVEFLIAQYHALTSVDGEQMYDNLIKMRLSLLKLGANNVTEQTSVNLQLFLFLLAQEPVAPLTHMPQYKSKEKTVGMLTYPILMAADIVASNADMVLVGDDQEAHMDYYRDIARRHDFKIAQTIKSNSPKIMSIKDPTKKMSKSLGDEHCIYIDDTLEEMKRKLKKAPTTPEGIANLKTIGSLFGYDLYGFNENECERVKQELAEVIFKEFNK